MRHLPLSSQLEYHRLIQRMKLLEKQREQKSQGDIQASNDNKASIPIKSEPSLPSLPRITVTLSTENRLIESNDSIEPENRTAIVGAAESTAEPKNLSEITANVASIEPSSTQPIPEIPIETNTVSNDKSVPVAKAPVTGTGTGTGTTTSTTPTIPCTEITTVKKTKSKSGVLNEYVIKYNNQR